jgi:uncharacterized damage-inducible protein DinB
MQEKSESQILWDVFEDVRGLTKFYLMRAAEVDPHRVFHGEDKSLNTLYWLMGHIVWAEHYLLVECLSGKRMDIPWIEKFDNGLEDTRAAGLPSVEAIRETTDRVHEQAKENVLGLDADGLEEDNHAGIQFRTGKSKRTIIHHAIRHEPCHAGQIGWLLKMAGVETV